MSTKLKQPVQTHEACRVCHGTGVETEIDVDYGRWNEIVLNDPCNRCGGDRYDRAETEEELNAAANRFSEDNMRMWEAIKLSECRNVIDS